jgi:hypothetical protein
MWRTPSLTRASPARPRSAGKKQSFEGVEYTIQELTKNRRATQQQHLLLRCALPATFAPSSPDASPLHSPIAQLRGR